MHQSFFVIIVYCSLMSFVKTVYCLRHMEKISTIMVNACFNSSNSLIYIPDHFQKEPQIETKF